jgi:hypothetical protein
MLMETQINEISTVMSIYKPYRTANWNIRTAFVFEVKYRENVLVFRPNSLYAICRTLVCFVSYRLTRRETNKISTFRTKPLCKDMPALQVCALGCGFIALRWAVECSIFLESQAIDWLLSGSPVIYSRKEFFLAVILLPARGSPTLLCRK